MQCSVDGVAACTNSCNSSALFVLTNLAIFCTQLYLDASFTSLGKLIIVPIASLYVSQFGAGTGMGPT